MKSNSFKTDFYTNQYNYLKGGLDFFRKANNGLIITNIDKENQLIHKNKEKVLSYIQTQKTAYLFDIMNKFDIDAITAKRILNLLEEEGKIKVNV